MVLFALVVCGCRHTQPVAPMVEYGQAGPGKIAILIAGRVERPGRYYLDDGATLASISDLFGGFRACETCGFTPSRVIVFPSGHPEQGQRYSLSRTNDLQAVRLRDGDRVSYATRHF
jgi:protein involved in polysaccharide export with SLBB domain